MAPEMNAPAPAASTNPATPAAELQQIAIQRPELGEPTMAHPNCYPGLADWIRAIRGVGFSRPDRRRGARQES
ncbi:MAG: hypothetical protein LBG11_07420 [Bifidobacteriaceae bacterium]|nr:hypothetical protein [Bifidobacteriaceae bacterium]